ncbi:MAG TPA: carbohydrate porin [Thermoanaerobaculia bacterium]|nr:carbohydrate porin [Thermoanaerobaculia bacterium]
MHPTRRVILPVALAACAAPLLARPPADEPPRADFGYQATTITQDAPSFRDPYEGPRSFRSEGSGQFSTTLSISIFTGLRLWKNAWISIDPEFLVGHGPGGGTGLGAFVNGDSVHAGLLQQRPYLARAFFHQDVPIGPRSPGPSPTDGESTERDLGAFLTGTDSRFRVPGQGSRLEITVGKVSLPDFMGSNDVAGDTHHRLMNLALITDGSWDYAADARGYTWGAIVELHLESPAIAVRFGSFALPREANGLELDHDYPRARGDNLELEWDFDPESSGVAKVLAWENRGRMGNYEEALAEAGSGAPDITAARAKGRTKRGIGVNLQRSFAKEWGVFLRGGGNDGRNETFCYTEIDRSFSAGVSHPGTFWRRPEDTVTVGVVGDGLSAAHRRYLARGGVGFQLGDGRLDYAHEIVAEANYDAPVGRATSVGLDVQRVWNPGYNADRGPIMVYGVRLHLHRP